MIIIKFHLEQEQKKALSKKKIIAIRNLKYEAALNL